MIDLKNDSITVHRTYADLYDWELSNAVTESQKNAIKEKFNKLNRKSEALEKEYKYPEGSLEGLHVITGSSNSLISRLPKPEYRSLLTNPSNAFIVKIKRGDPVIRTSVHTLERLS